jgi:hypothetical protein
MTFIQKYKIKEINPLLEIKRNILYDKIKNFVYSKVKKLLPKETHNMKFLDNFLTRLFFQQYVKDSYEEYKIDAFFPCKIHDYKQMILDLKYILKNKYSNKYLQEFNLDKILEKTNRKIYKFYSSKKYNYFKDKIIILYQDNKLNLLLDNKKIEKYSLDIRHELYKKLLNQIRKNNFTNDKNNLFIWCLLYRYNIFGNKTESLSVHPNIYHKIKKTNSGEPIELFSSGINSNFTNYCSLFYDIEQYFGSFGSFYTFDLTKSKNNICMFNPPFDNYVMEHAIIKLLEELNKISRKIIIYGFIPVWDNFGKKQTIKCNNKYMKPLDYEEYLTLDYIKESNYLKYLKIICQKEMPYLEYFSGRKIFATDTYLFILSNQDLDYSDIIKNKVGLITL